MTIKNFNMDSESSNEGLSNENEPKTNSTDPKERIQARSLRIQRRLEAGRKRLLALEADENNTIVEIEKSLLEKQVESSTVALLTLLEEGKELVTNVQVADELYEVNRRVNEANAKEIRLKKLEDEAVLAVEKFEKINSKWEIIATYNDPLDLHQETEAQKEKCMELIAQKDNLIGELKSELKAVDIRFVKDQVKQSEDITLLVERIDSLVKIMKRTYRTELNLIEQAISTERTEIVDAGNKRWEILYKEREKDEVSNLEHRFVALNEHNEIMNQIMIEHQEKYRATKISLEKDIQVLQQQLEQMKALCLLNKEKIEYNYQVLKKREEESLLIRSQQKRRINKLQDSVTTLRHKIQVSEQATLAEERRLTAEVVKLHRNIKDIQSKAEHFAIVNNSKYHQLWNFNHECAKKLLDKILNIDRIIHDQHLGIPWESPSNALMTKADMPSYQAAMDKIQASKTDNNSHEEKEDSRSSVINNRLMQYILKAIANNAGFLVERKLLQLLKEYTEEEETLVCLDNVFCALGLKSEEDIEHLRKALEPYTECKTCAYNQQFISRDIPRASGYLADEESKIDTMGSKSEDKPGFDEEEYEERAMNYIKGHTDRSVKTENSKSITSSTLASALTMNILPDIMQDESFPQQSVCNQIDHIHYIEPSNVLKTLKEFMDKAKHFKGREICTLNIKDKETPDTVSRLLKNTDVKIYWDRFCEIFSAEKEKLWDCLMIGLPKYLSVLQERHKINKEVEQLKVQNSELKHLLQRYALPNNMKVSSLQPTREPLPPLTVKSSQNLYKTPINLFLQLTENEKMSF